MKTDISKTKNLYSQLIRNDHKGENIWWYHFFQSLGTNQYDIEYADYLRINKVPPDEAAEMAKI